ncbi:ParB/RepB/Spo0J family partition protein [Gemmata sp.]|uniref:ParB/RepB/Spo0J family partition protein n=1 Tax=Gemmata sp. TaxID=1914242 RepID=UPI003F6FF686
MNSNTPPPAGKRVRTFRGTEYALSTAHPAADVLPWLGDDELQELADDIAAVGQRDDIDRLADGRILDGRNRELACLVAGVEPRYRDRESDISDADAVALVVSRIRRRDLTPSQRAAVAAELANMRVGRPADGKPATLPVSQADAAGRLGVSERSVRSAARVKEEAPEVFEQVKAGRIDVHTAEKVAKLPRAKRAKVAGAKDPKVEAKKHLPERAKTKTDAPVAGGTPPQAEPPGVAQGSPEPNPVLDFVSKVNRLCAALDRLKAEVGELAGDPFGRHIHTESVTGQLDAARKALWQSRPTEPCNCAAGGSDPKPGCRACFGCGRCPASRVLKGGR